MNMQTQELVLRDMSRRLITLMEQVRNGVSLDASLIEKLDEVSRFLFIKCQKDQQITNEELESMVNLLCLIEMRSTAPPDFT